MKIDKSKIWRERFAQHQITISRDDRWTMRMPDTHHMWMEIACIDGGKLLVHGDYNPVVFAHKGCPPATRVHWIGGCNRMTQYEIEKAKIGTGDGIESWGSDSAIIDIKEHTAELEVGDVSRGLWHDVIERAPWSCEDEMLSSIAQFTPDYCEYRFGVRPSIKMYAAWAAVNRLSTLLRER